MLVGLRRKSTIPFSRIELRDFHGNDYAANTSSLNIFPKPIADLAEELLLSIERLAEQMLIYLFQLSTPNKQQVKL